MTRYRVVVRGELSDRFKAGFAGLGLERAAGETVLEGELGGQEDLRELLEQLQELGLELVAVSPVGSQPP